MLAVASQLVFKSAATHRLQVLWRDVLAQYLAGNSSAPPPSWISAPCCGEFSVSAARVTARPRQLYVDLLAWTAKPASVHGDRCVHH